MSIRLVAVIVSVAALVACADDPTGVDESRLRNVIIYSTSAYGSMQLEVIRPDGSGRRRITNDGNDYYAADISLDGRRVAAARHDGSVFSIYVMNADGTGLKQIGRGALDYSPAWSPDGARIAFRSMKRFGESDYGRIFVMNADGSNVVQLTPDNPPGSLYQPFDDSPRWSRDGSQILFIRNGLLHFINADGTGLTSLNNEDGAADPDWSPDGARIAYGSEFDGQDIRTRSVDGSDLAGLTSGDSQEDGPSWSPDGNWLVFERIINQQGQLFIIAADGKGERKLSTTAVHETQPRWSPLR